MTDMEKKAREAITRKLGVDPNPELIGLWIEAHNAGMEEAAKVADGASEELGGAMTVETPESTAQYIAAAIREKIKGSDDV